MRAPWFWRDDSLAARIVASTLSPLSFVYDAIQRTRWRSAKPYKADIPVICIGNATLGGVGKTPFAIFVHALLKEAEIDAWFLTRGYGGCEAGPLVADLKNHSAADIGDEALLLAREGSVVVSRNRVAGAKMAAAEDAKVIIMDDGFQNPSLEKTLSILLIDAENPCGNGKVFPAGPLREPLARAEGRADMVIRITRSRSDDRDYSAWLEPYNAPPQKVVAFTGIGDPAKFFASLRNSGFDIAGEYSFPDHHRFRPAELKSLLRAADAKNAALITTEKDFVRLPGAMQEKVLTFPVAMQINDKNGFQNRLCAAIDAFK